MYKHILIPTDGSELSKKAVDQGIGLAKALNGKVTAVTVSEPFHIFAVEASMVTRNISRSPRMPPRPRACPAMWYRLNTRIPTRRLSIRREREDATQL